MPMAMASGKLGALRRVEMLRRARRVKRESKASTAALRRVKLLVMTAEARLDQFKFILYCLEGVGG